MCIWVCFLLSGGAKPVVFMMKKVPAFAFCSFQLGVG